MPEQRPTNVPFFANENRHLREAHAMRGEQAPDALWAPELIVPGDPQPTGPGPDVGPASRWSFARKILELRDVEREHDLGWTVYEGSYPGGGPHRFIELDPAAPATARRLGVPGRAWAKERCNTNGREQWISNFGQTFQIEDHLTWDRIEFGPYQGAGPKWGVRSYGTTASMTFRDCWAHDLTGTTDGHWVYASIAGGVYTFERCLAEVLYGQALQLRSDEDKGEGLHVPTRGGSLTVDGLVVLDCGMGARGSFPVSLWGMGRPGRIFHVTLRNVWIDNSWPAPSETSKGAAAKGGFMVENHPGFAQRSHGTVIIETLYQRLVGSDRGSYVNGAEAVMVNGCELWYSSGKGEVVIDRSEDAYRDHQPTGKTIWYGNAGNSPVYLGSPKYGGQLMGLASEDFVIEGGKRRDPTRADYAEMEDALGHAPLTRRQAATGVPGSVMR